MSRRSSSCCRTGGPGARLDQGPRGPWTGDTGRRQTALSAITSSGISSRRTFALENLLLRSDQGPLGPRTFRGYGHCLGSLVSFSEGNSQKEIERGTLWRQCGGEYAEGSYEVTKIFIHWVLIKIIDSLHFLHVCGKQEMNLEDLEKMYPHAKVIYVVWGEGVSLVEELQQLWLRRLRLGRSSSSGSRSSSLTASPSAWVRQTGDEPRGVSLVDELRQLWLSTTEA